MIINRNSGSSIKNIGILTGTLGTPSAPSGSTKNAAGLVYNSGTAPVTMNAATTSNEGNLKKGDTPSVQITAPKVYAGGTVTPGTANVEVVPAGALVSSAITMKGDSNLKAANIAEGVNIFGIVGTLKSSSGYVTLPNLQYDSLSGSAGSTSISGTIYDSVSNIQNWKGMVLTIDSLSVNNLTSVSLTSNGQSCMLMAIYLLTSGTFGTSSAKYIIQHCFHYYSGGSMYIGYLNSGSSSGTGLITLTSTDSYQTRMTLQSTNTNIKFYAASYNIMSIKDV